MEASENIHLSAPSKSRPSLYVNRTTGRIHRIMSAAGQTLLLVITLSSVFTVLFIFYYIIKDALPFFRLRGLREFFTSTNWYPSVEPVSFGALAIFIGSGLVTLGAIVFALPIGVLAAICLSDILPFRLRQLAKPIIELLAAIPSVAFGFFALVVLAPLLQDHGGQMMMVAMWLTGIPICVLMAMTVGSLVSAYATSRTAPTIRWITILTVIMLGVWGLYVISGRLSGIQISSGTNALNVSVILGIMALPTIVSVSEDALQAVGRDLREGAYALGATRAETMVRVVIPAAASGICAAVILGVMRAVGETMVVWMASGNAAQIPKPWYNLLDPIRTLTATIAGDMGEADHVTGSARYHVLFVMAFCLLSVSYLFNMVSEKIARRSIRKKGK